MAKDGEIVNYRQKVYITYQTASFLMTLSDLPGQSFIANFFKCDFLCNFAPTDKISTDTGRRAVPVCVTADVHLQ